MRQSSRPTASFRSPSAATAAAGRSPAPSGVIQTEELGKDKRDKILHDKDLDLAGGPEMKQVFTDFKSLRDYSDDGYANRNWNDTWKLVDSGKAAVQIMGDWERGEFAAKGEVGTKDYGCIAGFDDAHPTATTSGDVFVFPKQTDPRQGSGPEAPGEPHHLPGRAARLQQCQGLLARPFGTSASPRPTRACRRRWISSIIIPKRS